MAQEHFPFEQIVGLIVFVIIALAQFWTKLRTGKPMPRSEEPEPEFEFPDFGEEKPLAPSPRPDGSAPPKLDDFLREALGLPSGPGPSPVAPPPTLARTPTPPSTIPQQRRPITPSSPVPSTPPPAPKLSPDGPVAGNVLASLERLERETSRVRERVEQIGHLEVAAGAEAEARMRQRLAGIVKDLGLSGAPTPATSPRGKSPIGQLIADRNTLRRAIVLNEILGPPRSLHPLG